MSKVTKIKLTPEEMHDKVFEGLCDLAEKYQELGIAHMVYIGISFFTQMAVDCAPSEKEGKSMVKDVIKTTTKDEEFKYE